MKEWSTVGIKGYVMLMLEFMRLSPTYELARKARNEGLSEADKKLLPSDFDKVLSTYDEFGDVSTITFNDWWEAKGIYIFGSEFIKPEVRLIANVDKGEKIEPGFHRALDHYFKVTRLHEGEGPSLILSVPLGMNKRYVMRQISLLIDRSGVATPVKAKKAKKELTAQRLRSAPLFTMLHLLRNKAANPNLELWRLGVIAKVSPANMEGLDARAIKVTSKTTDQRINMQILTSRYLLKAKRMVEHSARGNFPKSTPIDLPVFDYEAMYQRHKKFQASKRASN
jgi:hypothetical protein